MKKLHSNKKIIVSIILLIVVVLLGAEIALQIYKLEELKTIIIGILSGTNLTFIYLLFMSPRSPYISKGDGFEIEFPGDLKYLALFFFLSIIIYWSLRYVHIAIVYIINIL